MRLDKLPRISLTQLPTPLIEAPRLANGMGLRKLLIKRDDCTTLGMGGNKVRKLEFLMADALEKGADVVMTCGGPQSNHARLTAAACRKVGIERCILFLGGPDFERMNGNLLLDSLFGAEIRFMVDATVKEMDEAMNEEAERLRANGHNPYVIPIGGSSPQGAMGYTAGIRELAGQLGDEDKCPLIFFAVGSCGTLTGVALGCRLFLPGAEIIGISVSRKATEIKKIVAKVAPAATQLLGIDCPIDASEIRVEDCYYGERYGVPSEAGNAAVLETAQSEAIVLDPIYTGKAMSGLMDMARRKLIDTDRTVIFLHTGGGPGLFAFDYVFRDNAKLVRV